MLAAGPFAGTGFAVHTSACAPDPGARSSTAGRRSRDGGPKSANCVERSGGRGAGEDLRHGRRQVQQRAPSCRFHVKHSSTLTVKPGASGGHVLRPDRDPIGLGGLGESPGSPLPRSEVGSSRRSGTRGSPTLPSPAMMACGPDTVLKPTGSRAMRAFRDRRSTMSSSDEREVVDHLDGDGADRRRRSLSAPQLPPRQSVEPRGARTCRPRECSRTAGLKAGHRRSTAASMARCHHRSRPRQRSAAMRALSRLAGEEIVVMSRPLPAVVGPPPLASDEEGQCLRSRLVAAADRTLHRRRPPGVAPGAGEEQAVQPRSWFGGRNAPVPGTARNVAAFSR